MKKICFTVFSFVLLISLWIGCNAEAKEKPMVADNFTPNQLTYQQNDTEIICGAERIGYYAPKLMNKKVGLVANHSSRFAKKHLLDSLLELGVEVVKVFSPEHGFRGEADAGEKVKDGKDPRTGIPIVSLYGQNRKPTEDQLKGLEIVVFDIQDVGVRFYTYISTLHNVMEACAEQNIPIMILDRPNPNGHYVDGPVLKSGFNSFVGMHEVPVVYGMTIGEYASMINGEGWLKDGISCVLEIVELKNYDHKKLYRLPIQPSPNLPNLRAVLLYPSLCFFEPTIYSIGRGTDKQFQIIGHPQWSEKSFEFTPMPNFGAKDPKLNGQLCKGVDLTIYDDLLVKSWRGINLAYLLEAYQAAEQKDGFFTSPSFFDKLAGSDGLRKQIIAGNSEEEIKDSWQTDLKEFMLKRSKYLLYK